jgi:seryl-tRNA synthetase
MLDLKFIRENPEEVKTSLARKGIAAAAVDELLNLAKKKRTLLQEVGLLKASRNKVNDEIAQAKRNGKAADQIIAGMKSVSQKIDDIDIEVGHVGDKLALLMVNIPNIPHESVPDGDPPAGNKIVRSWGEEPKFNFNAKDHMALAKQNGWISFERAAKVSGAGFALFEGSGARLVRALINFMIDLHTREHGYEEVWPPSIVNRASMTGTGQLPKMAEDMYQLKDDDLFLIPTAEVPVSNMYQDDVFQEEALPIKRVAYTPCFRREAGSYGKDTRGLSRLHQFDKVELVQFVRPEDSLDALEGLVGHAEKVLQLLEIPYRVALLCAKDLSFAGGKCYDLEAYAPGAKKWFEVSSCSAFFDFQARRMNVKYKAKSGSKQKFVHTLNGSGVALARTIICLMENHQQADGTIKIPGSLKPYMEPT